jgi:hypothetical protein
VIADCVCQANRITAEWLVRDSGRLAWSLGIDPKQLAERLAQADMAGDPARHAWLQEEVARVRGLGRRAPPADHPAAPVAAALYEALAEDAFGSAAQIASPCIEVQWPSGRRGVGQGAWVGCLMQLRAPLGEHSYILDHWAARPRPDGDLAVALRWWLIGQHVGAGVCGTPTHRQLVILAISHYRLRGERIIEDFTVIDEVGVLRQSLGGLGACRT